MESVDDVLCELEGILGSIGYTPPELSEELEENDDAMYQFYEDAAFGYLCKFIGDVKKVYEGKEDISILEKYFGRWNK